MSTNHDISDSSKPSASSRKEQQHTKKRTQIASQQPARPINDDREVWSVYWQAQGQRWRTEPEIRLDRQQELEKYRLRTPEEGIFNPFQGVKLERADIEWLIEMLDKDKRKHANGNNEKSREHEGLNLFGADLQNAQLQRLPLKFLKAGTIDSLSKPSQEEAIVNLKGTNLIGAQLEGADFTKAQLEGANLTEAQLKEACLIGAQLERANLRGARLKRADLTGAQLQKANLIGAYLGEAKLNEVHLEGADLREACLEGANLRGAHLEGARLNEVHLEGADLNLAQLAGANLIEARLTGTKLIQAHLERADLRRAHLEGADLREAYLEGANLADITLWNEQHIGPQLVDVQWGSTNLAIVEWSQVSMPGDEYFATQKTYNGEIKDSATRLREFKAAVRANRQLTVALQNQGLNEDAARFAYRAQRLQRIVLRRQRKVGAYLFSGFLDLLAGYGYKPVRSVIAYLVVIFGFMGLYLLNAHFVTPHLGWDEALVLSVSSFHGRGFFSQDISLGDTYARLAAAEAVIGLLIEISFIATFTQRYFGK